MAQRRARLAHACPGDGKSTVESATRGGGEILEFSRPHAVAGLAWSRPLGGAATRKCDGRSSCRKTSDRGNGLADAGKKRRCGCGMSSRVEGTSRDGQILSVQTTAEVLAPYVDFVPVTARSSAYEM